MSTEPLRADLHCHSRYSDGSCTVEEILSIAKAQGLQAIALTDHDTFAGAAAAQTLGRAMGICVVPGLEISSRDPETGRKVHILAYLCRDPEPVEHLCRRTLRSRHEGSLRSAEIIAKEFHLPLSFLMAEGRMSTALYKQHLMQALLSAGIAKEMFGDLFHELFRTNTGRAFFRTEYPSVWEAVDAVHEAGGLAVLAHPDAYRSTDVMQELVRRGKLDGIETEHPRNLPEHIPHFYQLCRDHNLLMTGGSDFHGCFGRGVSLGIRTAPNGLPERFYEIDPSISEGFI